MVSAITKIAHKKGKNKDRVYVYINGVYCASVRERTWPALKLDLGSNITCSELKERESFVWKGLYGKDSWVAEKERIKYVTLWLNKYIAGLDVVVSGFGADSTEFIRGHSEEKGEPDLALYLEETDSIVAYLEVTGTKYKQGTGYWVRPDKIDFIQSNPGKDVWIALHYEEDKKVVWIRVDKEKKYSYEKKDLRGATEYYVVFEDASREVKSSAEFKEYIDAKVAEVRGGYKSHDK